MLETAFLRGLIYNALANMNACKIGEVVSISNTSYVSVKVLHDSFINKEVIEYPLIENVPLLQFMASGFIIKVPVVVGSKVLLLFADSDIENLLIKGSKSTQNTTDVHAVNDAIAIPMAFNVFGNTIGPLGAENLYIGKIDGTMSITVDNNSIDINGGSNDININTTGNFNVTSNNFNTTP